MIDAQLIEATEIAAWKDLIDAAPEPFKTVNGIRYRATNGGLLINFQQLPVPLFNRAIGLGLGEPLTKDLIDEIRSYYTHHEKYLIHYSPPMQPEEAEWLLVQNGYSIGGAWERVIRNNAPLTAAGNSSITVLQVDEAWRERWVTFLCDTYGFDFYEWPRAFCPRTGWKHYLALQHGRILACRSFFTTDRNTVFSGVDGPVPGVMTPDTAPDFAIWERAISDHIRAGAQLFVADIELPDRDRNKSAYEGFRRLGFEIPYTRHHYVFNSNKIK